MRLLNTFILSILLLGGLSFSTCNQAKADELPQSVSQKMITDEIKRKLSFPEELIGKTVNERVVIEFKINKSKKLDIIGIETLNPTLKAHITKQLELVEVPESENFAGRVLQISVLFYNEAQ